MTPGLEIEIDHEGTPGILKIDMKQERVLVHPKDMGELWSAWLIVKRNPITIKRPDLLKAMKKDADYTEKDVKAVEQALKNGEVRT